MATAEMTGTLLGAEHLDGKLFNGSWIPAAERLDDLEPATGDTLASVGNATPDDVFAASKAAAAAQPGWAALPPRERAAVFHRAADALEANAAEVQGWLVREGGKIPPVADFEIGFVVNELREAATLPSRSMGEILPDAQGRYSIARRLPLGVVGAITPWNMPLILSMRTVAPAMALGNTVVLKTDPQAPVGGGLVIARIFEEAGLPEGVLHVLPGGIEAGEAICDAPEIRMVSFTGSTRAGRLVGARAGGNLKRVALELGGKSSFIVLDDVDVDSAASAGAWGSFVHQGQICMASGRHLVQESIAEKYIEALAAKASHLPVGNPATDQVALGPIINQKQIDRVQEIVSETVDAGGNLRAGGTADGPYFPATVISDMQTSMRGWNEEIFGPVAPIMTFKDEAEAIALANDTEYGLSAGVYTSIPARGRAVADALHTGHVHIGDQSINDDPIAPFGGVGASGNGGRFGGDANLEEFTQWRWITERAEPATYPF